MPLSWYAHRLVLPRRAMLRYRPLPSTDESVLWSLFYYAISVPPGEPAPPRDVIHRPELERYVRDWGTRAGDRGIAAEVDGTPIGAAWLENGVQRMEGLRAAKDA